MKFQLNRKIARDTFGCRRIWHLMNHMNSCTHSYASLRWISIGANCFRCGHVSGRLSNYLRYFGSMSCPWPTPLRTDKYCRRGEWCKEEANPFIQIAHGQREHKVNFGGTHIWIGRVSHYFIFDIISAVEITHARMYSLHFSRTQLLLGL